MEGAEEMVEEGTSSMASSSPSSGGRVSASSMAGAAEFLRTMRSGTPQGVGKGKARAQPCREPARPRQGGQQFRGRGRKRAAVLISTAAEAEQAAAEREVALRRQLQARLALASAGSAPVEVPDVLAMAGAAVVAPGNVASAPPPKKKRRRKKRNRHARNERRKRVAQVRRKQEGR